ncbi:MAG TPA: CARDB domain-containing protein [Candidatus Thermoplasmatota archaeon]|nr:CARDB domain-containing protein [Candidatus Thermoplasmatota archaeon]
MRPHLLVLLLLVAALPHPALASSSLPDFVIVGLSFAPAQPQAYEAVVVSILVENAGAGSLMATKLGLYLEGVLVDERYIPPLGAGDQYLAQLAFGAGAGTHDLAAIVNDDDAVPESDHTNNAAPFQVVILAPPPDVAPSIGPGIGRDHTGIWTDVGPVPHPLGTRRIEVSTCNHGGPAENVQLALWVEGASGGASLVGGAVLAQLGQAECQSTTFEWSPVGAVGDVRFRARAQAAGDSDPANDESTRDDFVVVGGLGAGALVGA